MKRISLLRAAIAMVGKTAIAIVLVLCAIAAYHLYTLPLPPSFQEPDRSALTLTTSDGTTAAFRGASRGYPITFEEMPQHLVDAVLTMEDRRFFEHGGVDPRGLLRAALANFDAGEVVQGGSTITQQLARLEFLSADQTLSRKIQEALLALWLERHLSKQEILARYLNSIYLGAGAYGLDAASRRYFEKPATQVSLPEAAMLAGLIPAPSLYAPSTSPEEARQRATLVLDAMAEAGVITSAAAEEAKARLPDLAVPPAERAGFGYIADWAASETRERLDRTTGDFRVLTTTDPALQRLATETVQRWLRDEGAKENVTQAALVAMRPDGSVLAMVGGVDYAASQFNRAVQARRQPGSAFKLFVYLAALEAGYDPESPIDDAPIRIGNWSPQNYGRRFRGMTTLRTAFAQSINAASIRLQERVGRDRVIEMAKAMGLSSQLDPNPSLALGTNEVTLLELTAAYAAVQAGRRPVRPRVVRAVESLGGARLTMDQRDEVAPLPRRDAMLSMLREVVRSGTGKAAALSAPSYGKTGTTQDYRDAWFVGFAGDLVVGVWVGNDDQSSMEDVTGGRPPARIWRAFMAEALVLSRSQGEVDDQEPAEPPSEPTTKARDLLVGRADVIDTATLQLGHRRVRLEGVKGIGGRAARDIGAAGLCDRRGGSQDGPLPEPSSERCGAARVLLVIRPDEAEQRVNVLAHRPAFPMCAGAEKLCGRTTGGHVQGATEKDEDPCALSGGPSGFVFHESCDAHTSYSISCPLWVAAPQTEAPPTMYAELRDARVTIQRGGSRHETGWRRRVATLRIKFDICVADINRLISIVSCATLQARGSLGPQRLRKMPKAARRQCEQKRNYSDKLP